MRGGRGRESMRKDGNGKRAKKKDERMEERKRYKKE